MTIQIDPVWPWSELRQFLADSPDPIVPVLVWATALLALALPLVMLRPMSRRQRHQLLAIGGLWFLVQCVWVAAGSPSSSVSLGEQVRFAGLTLLVIAPMGLLGWMLRTYIEAPALTRRRLLSLLALRLAAVVCAIVAVTRPFLGFPDTTRTGAVILILVDATESMTIQDQDGGPRWERMLRALKECEPLLAQLRSEQGIDVEFYRFDRNAGPWRPDNPGKPTGKRTDVGAALRWLFDNRDRRPLRGLYVLSDGRNNGPQQISALTEVKRWRKAGCPVHTVLLGNPNTPNGQRDIAVTRVTPASSLFQVKTEISAVARIDAPGFEGRTVKVRVFLKPAGDEGVEREVTDAKVETLQRSGNEVNYVGNKIPGQSTLPDSRNNEVRIRFAAPDQHGEYRLTVRVEDPLNPGHPLAEELNKENNQASTFITVIKGGISVLLVDRPRAGEPQLLFDVLKSDPRFRPRVVWLGKGRPLSEADKNLFQFEKEKYDVIVIGDVLAGDIKAVNPNALNEIADLVDKKGSGLVMLGGYSTFGNGDWQGTPLDALLPVKLSERGQIEDKIQMIPTDDGLKDYGFILGLAPGQQEPRDAWKQLPPLDGMPRMVQREGTLVHVLAKSNKGGDMLVAWNAGDGRVLAFAGDTTYRWTATPDGRLKHSRFWRQMMVWLAKQEAVGGNVWVKPDVRDVPVGVPDGFNVGVRGKGGIDLPNGVFEVDVVLPNGQVKRVTTARSGGEDRGQFRPDEPGEYVIKAKGKARDPEGNEVTGTGEAHFMANEEDVEMAEWSADKAFMDKLAKEGRGKAATPSELPGLLKELLAPALLERGKPKLVPLPDWRSSKKSAFLPLFVLIFVGVLTGEWFLRRRWGMV